MWSPGRPPFIQRNVIVNLKDDKSTALRGVLWSSSGPWFVLRNVMLLRTGADGVSVDGEVVVHRDNVSFVQVL